MGSVGVSMCGAYVATQKVGWGFQIVGRFPLTALYAWSWKALVAYSRLPLTALYAWSWKASPAPKLKGRYFAVNQPTILQFANMEGATLPISNRAITD